jgi:hypothetical protein
MLGILPNLSVGEYYGIKTIKKYSTKEGILPFIIVEKTPNTRLIN